MSKIESQHAACENLCLIHILPESKTEQRPETFHASSIFLTPKTSTTVTATQQMYVFLSRPKNRSLPDARKRKIGIYYNWLSSRKHNLERKHNFTFIGNLSFAVQLALPPKYWTPT
jgi:hypothetical protein